MPADASAPVAADTASFEPVSVEARFDPPRADVDPDRSKSWFPRLLPVVLANRALFGIAVLAGIVGMLTSVAAPAVLGFAINDALRGGGGATTGARAAVAHMVQVLGLGEVLPSGGLSIETYVALLLLIGVVRIAAQAFYRYGLYRVAYQIETDMRSLVYEHITRLSFSFFDKIQTGQVISRANSDIRSVQMFLTFAPMMLMTLVSFTLAFSFMLTIHVGLTLVAIAALPGVLIVGRRLRALMFPISWMTQQRLADVATIVDENIHGVRVVKSFAAEESQVKTLARTAQRLLWASYEMVEARARHAPLMENIARLGPAAVLLYGGWLVMQGRIEGVGTLIMFNTYMIMLQAPFRILGFFLAMSQRAAASAVRIFEILDQEAEVQERPGATELPAPRGEVQMKGVRFGYGDGPDLLEDFDLQIEAGETLALVGRTGCGKSTVARLLARFYDVRDGSVQIDGHDVRDVTLASLRARVGLVLDEPFLFSMSVRDNIAYGKPDATSAEIEAAARAAQAHDFIVQLADGYDTVVGERGYDLSGGQRQRIALARMFLVNPPLLVLDDATSAIDVQVEAEIHGALSKLLEGRTTLVIAHRLSTIALATRVALMEGGKVVATGTHEELMRREPRYAEVLAHAEERQAPPPPQEPTDESDLAYRMRIRRMVTAGDAPGGGSAPQVPGGGVGGFD